MGCDVGWSWPDNVQCTLPDNNNTRHPHNKTTTPIVRLYRAKLDEYYGLNKREGRAYGAYAVATTLLPNLVIALVLYYGGQLVLNEDGMTSGKLVSFLLLLSSLSDAFNNMVRNQSCSCASGATNQSIESN